MSISPAPGASGALSIARYVPALDGLRGICTMAVLVGHLAIFAGYDLLFDPHLVRWLGGGELGLEVFFVLSGALITHLALVEVTASGTLDLRAFRVRRVRRLGPALVIIVATTIALAATGIHGNALPLGQHQVLVVVTVLALGSNWLLFSGADLGYLTPTWSLTVEEQFYVVWPLLLRRAWGRIGASGTALIALSLLVAGQGTSAALVSHGVFATYTTPVAGIGLLCGCLVAIGLHSDWAPHLARVLSSTPVALATAVAMGFTARWLHFHVGIALRGGYLLFDVESALLIGHLIVRSTHRSPVARALSARPLAYLGRISYGAYLYHVTIYQMWDRSGLIGNSATKGVIDVGSTLLIAALSFRLIEEPIRRGRVRLPSRMRSPVRGRLAPAGLPDSLSPQPDPLS